MYSLEESVRAKLAQVEEGLSICIVKLNRFGFLESILPPDTLTALVKIYGEELKSWFAATDAKALMTLAKETWRQCHDPWSCP